MSLKKEILPLGKPGKKEAPNLSPKELWHQKEKALKFKGILIILFTHLGWASLYFSPSPTVEAPKKLELAAHHEIIQLPVWNYSTIPPFGQKSAVSLFKEGESKVIKGYLRSLDPDPLGSTGHRATLEIPKKDLLYIKSHSGAWQLYPPLEPTEAPKKRRNYEWNF